MNDTELTSDDVRHDLRDARRYLKYVKALNGNDKSLNSKDARIPQIEREIASLHIRLAAWRKKRYGVS